MFRFVRPARGFRISLLSAAQKYIDAECKENPKLSRLWGDMFARMKMTALKEGEEIKKDLWSFVAEGSEKLGIPTLQVLFTHDTRTLYIQNAIVWQKGEGQEEEDEW